jgi:predicted GIY-YIG superfamily endonuclease
MTSDWMFHCYMLRCADGTYYVGQTDDIDQRIGQHQAGWVKGYTFKRRPVELVWNDQFQTRDDAKSAERQIKGWGRAKKEALIAGDWERISELARSKCAQAKP